MDVAITLLAIVGLILSAAGLTWLYSKGRAYRRLIRYWRYQSLADERNPRTRAIRKFSQARVIRHPRSVQ